MAKTGGRGDGDRGEGVTPARNAPEGRDCFLGFSFSFRKAQKEALSLSVALVEGTLRAGVPCPRGPPARGEQGGQRPSPPGTVTAPQGPDTRTARKYTKIKVRG